MDFSSLKLLLPNVEMEPTPTLVLQTALGIVVLGRLYQAWRNRIDIPTYGGILSFSRLLSTVRLALEGGDIWQTSYAKA
ncbi:hypothetical protein FRC17_002743, partial [Serendipita sp. 399]